MKKIRTIYDIENDKRIEEKEKAKEEISKDIKDIFEKIKPKLKKKEKKFSWIKLFGGLFALLFFVTLVLGCIWLIKIFIGGIF